MKIKVISAFNDSENKFITRNVGDEFETDDTLTCSHEQENDKIHT